MIDFLKSNPFVGKEEYLWTWTVPQVKLAMNDFSHEEYIPKSKRKKKEKVEEINTAEDLMRSCGIPISAMTKK